MVVVIALVSIKPKRKDDLGMLRRWVNDVKQRDDRKIVDYDRI